VDHVSRSEDQVLVRCMALLALSVVLMVAAHLLAFAGSAVSEGRSGASLALAVTAAAAYVATRVGRPSSTSP
jgi:hypothetical protein